LKIEFHFLLLSFGLLLGRRFAWALVVFNHFVVFFLVSSRREINLGLEKVRINLVDLQAQAFSFFLVHGRRDSEGAASGPHDH
jgi:hypothetical protein